MFDLKIPNVHYIGPAAEHDMACAVCWVNPAVLQCNSGIFMPCWKCQDKGYQLTRKRKKWSLYRPVR